MMSDPAYPKMRTVVGCEWSLGDLFEGPFDPSYATLAVLYHHRISHALLQCHHSPHRTSGVLQRRFQIGLYYEVVSSLSRCV